jgi:prepilin-type N-terminal cleavage/methylation domain-containing protein
VIGPVAQRARRATDGFTVVELMVSVAIIGVAFAIFAAVFASTIRNSGEVQNGAVLQGEVRAAVDRLAQDLRQAYTGDTTSPVETMTGTQLTFLSPDRGTPLHLRRIAYRLSSGALERAIAVSSNTNGPPWTIPALGPYARQFDSVKNTTLFTYFDSDGLTTTVPADVASVTVTVKVATKTQPARQFTYSTTVALRTNE